MSKCNNCTEKDTDCSVCLKQNDPANFGIKSGNTVTPEESPTEVAVDPKPVRKYRLFRKK